MTTFMRFSILKFNNETIRKILAFIALTLILLGGLKAQNVSYNLNSTPISGGSDNTAFGASVLSSNTTGIVNSAVGKFALYNNTTGNANMAFGHSSLYNNTTGSSNSGIGQTSLLSNTAGSYNTGIGTNSMFYNINGNYNVGNGYQSLINNTSGNNNASIGSFSLYSNITGTANAALGYFANVGSNNLTNATAIGANSIVNVSNAIQLGDANVTQIFGGVGNAAKFIAGQLQITGGSPTLGYVLTSDNAGNATWQPAGGGGGSSWDINGNTGTVDGTNFIGTTDNVPLNFRVNNQSAGRIDPIFFNNTTYGYQSGNFINTGIRNTAIGEGAIYALGDGSNNSALGFHALYLNRNAIDNTAIGSEALTANQEGNQNTAVGSQALANNSNGPYNSALGFQALTSNISGENNTAIGFKSLAANSTGNLNTATGGYSMLKNTTGQNNTAFGYESLHENISGGNNSAIGFQALFYNTTGLANHAFGQSALIQNTTGTYNAAVGYAALGFNTTGNYNTSIGDLSDVTFSSVFDNATAIGARTIVNASNKIRLGDPAVTMIEGTVAFSPSDERFKFDVKEEDVKGLEFINKLRPVVYNFDTKKFQEFLTQTMPEDHRKKYFENRDFRPSTAIRQSGFIAQEVEKAAKEVGYDFNGVHVPESKNDNYSLAYSEFVVPLVKSVQELSRQNDSLKKEIAEIKAMIIANGTGKSTTGSISIAAGEGAKLFQNAPNPFSKATTIRYTLPDNTKRAMISITSISGIKLKEFDLKSKGGQSIEINGGQLAAGTYIYSLYVDNNLIDSRQMILTK